jgi:hypothetical protein
MVPRSFLPLKQTGSHCSSSKRALWPAGLKQRLPACASLVVFLLLAPGHAASAGDLQRTIKTLQGADRTFVPASFYGATCDAQRCRTAAADREPEIGSIVQRDSGQPAGYKIVCAVSGEAEYPIQTPQYAPVRTMPLDYDRGTLTKVFGTEPDGIKSAGLVASLAQDVRLEGRDPYTESAFSGENMRRAAATLPRSCRSQTSGSSAPVGMIIERVFATVVLDVAIKPDIQFEELKLKLLELEKLVQVRYQARIGLGQGTEERRLEISTHDQRLVSFRITPLKDLKVYHRDWFE